MQISINQAISELRRNKVETQRSTYELKFGSKENCRKMFEEAFRAVDLSVENYTHLPEYDYVIDWMTDTKGKGLFLTGDCGRGKSIILTGVIPALMFQLFNKVLNNYGAFEIVEKSSMISKQWAISIDDVGIEPTIKDYGENIEGFNIIVDAAEARIAPLFISTNLNSSEILARYGERTFDRIFRLCKVVKFTGESLRK